MSYINPIELIQVLELHFEGTLDQIPEISYLYRDVRDWYFSNQLRGLVDSEIISNTLLSISPVSRQVILHYFTECPESLEILESLYVKLAAEDAPEGYEILDFDEWYGEVFYNAINETETYLLENYL